MRTALQAAGIDYDSAEASFVPDMQVALDRDGARKMFRLVDALEDLDDVQNVFANFDVSDEIMDEPDDARLRARGVACAGLSQPSDRACESARRIEAVSDASDASRVSLPHRSPSRLACPEQVFGREARQTCACSGSTPA